MATFSLDNNESRGLGAPHWLDRQALLVALAGLALAPVLGMYVAGAPTVVLLAVVGLAAAASFLRRPHWAAYAFCFTMVFTHVTMRTGFAALMVGDLSAMLVVVTWLLQRLATAQRPRLMPGWVFLPGMLAWMLASLLLSGSAQSGAGSFLRLVLVCATCLALMDLLADEARLRKAIWLLCLAGLVEAFLALGEFGHGYRVEGAYDQANVFGNAMAMSAIAAFTLLLCTRDRLVQVALAAALGLLLLGVLLSISRGTYLGLVVALLWWVRHNRRMLVLVLALSAATAGLMSWNESQKEEIAERLQMNDTSVEHRLITLQNGVAAIQAKPLFGVGLFTQLDQHVEVTAQAGRSAHNLYISLAASSGVPALLMYLGFVGMMMRHLQRKQAPRGAATGGRESGHALLLKGAQAALIYVLVATLTKGGSLPLWGQLGMCAAASLMPEREPTETA